MVDDGLEHLSKKTRERAFVLARNAKSIGLPLGAVRFTPHHDYMSYYLTDGSSYIIIFCTPNGYLAEMWSEKEVGNPTVQFFGVKNIRHLLQLIKRMGYKDIDEVQDTDSEDETDLREFLEGLDESE